MPDSHAPDPHGEHLLLLADGPAGYARLARALSLGHLAGEKGAPQFTLGRRRRHGRRATSWVLTGCRKGAVPRGARRATARRRPRASCSRLIDAFGRDRVLVELWDHGDPLDSARNDALAELAAAPRRRLRRHQQRPLRHAGPAPPGHRARRRAGPAQPGRARPVAAGGGRRPPALAAPSRRRRFARYPGVVELAAEIGRAAAFDLSLVAPNAAAVPVPARRVR